MEPASTSYETSLKHITLQFWWPILLLLRATKSFPGGDGRRTPRTAESLEAMTVFGRRERGRRGAAAGVTLLAAGWGTKSSNAATFTAVNKCGNTVSVGTLSGPHAPLLHDLGFVLQPGESKTFPAPAGWYGSLWGRTGCSEDSATGKFSCVTGDCGSSTVECAGSGPNRPATVAEFTLSGNGGIYFYAVSLIDGYNLPMTVEARGRINCEATGCVVDINEICPWELKETSGGNVVACKSACQAFGDPRDCCTGPYATATTCEPNPYSKFFKSACPRASTYAYDDHANFTCEAAADYLLTFCPRPSSINGGEPLLSNRKHSMAVVSGVIGSLVVSIFLVLAWKLKGCLKDCWSRTSIRFSLELAARSSSTN